ncbi:hypothetical protein KFK14_12795 [Sphingobium phenoxybenzoativorans]|uniref:Uncharacterized protein n=1 Tax=Sphingobium phenoxybenzoativorans TaxID=1592790 RepID=A0A975K433_9SPHN|nr:hypothetical protein [Sphingobium phenoxybenzoativorans]QUT04024.1 hypothetical protein KFK14_12795 [Sphingobium phenoxybenzoativorans]
MFRRLSLADASPQQPIAPKAPAATAPLTGSTNPVVVEADDGATFPRGHWGFDRDAYKHAILCQLLQAGIYFFTAIIIAAVGAMILLSVAFGA